MNSLEQGFANTPYPWQPSVVHIQMLRIGQFVILVVPGEFTTMAGRRIRLVLILSLFLRHELIVFCVGKPCAQS